MVSRTTDLNQVLTAFGRCLHLPDPGIVEIALATVAANRIPGDPVWLLLAGPASSGKTETLSSLMDLPDMYAVSTLTEASLLSGTPVRQVANGATGGLLRQIDTFGIIVLKDFTSILSMNRNTSTSLLAALREIYDGAWARHLGVDGARTLEWEGKVGLIGGVTSAIDSAHSIMSSMGQRFALYRLPEIDAHAQARRALEKTGGEVEMRADLKQAVATFFKGLDFETPPMPENTNHEWIIALATFVARCRSAVDRHSYSREIELIHDAEAPARLTRMLAQLLRGLQLIGVITKRRRELIVKVGQDCIPPVRRLALEALLKHPGPAKIADILVEGSYAEPTVRRALEDLACFGIVEHGARHRVADTWGIADHWRQQWEITTGLSRNVSDSP